MRLLLAIRTIVVTTRVAVHSHRKAGNEELGRESARRGAKMLAELGRELPPDDAGTIGQTYREAERELREFMTPAPDLSTPV